MKEFFLFCMIWLFTCSAFSQIGVRDSLSTRSAKIGNEQFKWYSPETDDETLRGNVEWRIELTDDNGDVDLPARFRTWYYFRIDGVSTSLPSKINIVGDGFPGRSVVVPVFSYDRKNWYRLRPEDIVESYPNNGYFDYTIEKQFTSSHVWIARYYPYSYARLNNFINRWRGHQYLKVENIGYTTLGKPIPMLTITDPSVDDSNKKRIWIHSRTHASETGSSFVMEGLIDFLLSDCNYENKKVNLSKLIFNIVPMVNIDGVVAGNSRVSPDSSYDFERQWKRNPDNDYELEESVPSEVKTLHGEIKKLISKCPMFIMALNLHSKNAYPSWRSFLYSNFYGNFKKVNKKYGAQGDSIFYRTLSFAQCISKEYCADTISVRASEEIERPMENKLYPESWWWVNYKDSVLAVTLETTTGKHSCFEGMTTFNDHLQLGESLAIAIQSYYDRFVENKYFEYFTPQEDAIELLKFFVGNTNGR